VAGFSLSQYFLANHSHLETAALRGELQTQLGEIRATAERLERATLNDRGAAAGVIDGRRGVDDVTVTATLGPCRPRPVTVTAAAAAADAAPACSEPDAPRVTLCASVPSSAAVTALLLYARPEDAARPWTENPVAPGQEVGRARFADKPYERIESDLAKQVCTEFSAWDAERAYSARLVVKYAIATALRENTHAMVVPISETR
jgi:hypothetical protein